MMLMLLGTGVEAAPTEKGEEDVQVLARVDDTVEGKNLTWIHFFTSLNAKFNLFFIYIYFIFYVYFYQTIT